MQTVSFTPNLKRHLDCPEVEIPESVRSVADALEEAFRQNSRLRGYVLDEQGRLRQHVAVFVGGEQVKDRIALTDPVRDGQDVFVMQALSGG